MKCSGVLKDALVTVLLLTVPFAVLALTQELCDMQSIAPMVFVLAVFLTSLLTNGYFFGIAASLLGVLAVNFAFTFPYFALNFSIPVNLFSALTMLCVAVSTSALTTIIKRQQKLRAESEAEKMRANLLRAISHDLRTPLTSIYGSCSTVIENYDLLSESQQLKLLGEVRTDCKWLIRMVENLLSITRIDGSDVAIVKTPVVLEELISDVVAKFGKACPDVPVTIDIPDGFISIPMDALLIEQVIINLLENAAYHAEGMTELTLRVYTKAGRAVFEIEDDGCGIRPELLGTLFGGVPNSQKAPADGKKSSMGIGLSVCAAIVKAHGGTISAANRNHGGALFRFSLDMEANEDEQ